MIVIPPPNLGNLVHSFSVSERWPITERAHNRSGDLSKAMTTPGQKTFESPTPSFRSHHKVCSDAEIATKLIGTRPAASSSSESASQPSEYCLKLYLN